MYLERVRRVGVEVGSQLCDQEGSWEFGVGLGKEVMGFLLPPRWVLPPQSSLWVQLGLGRSQIWVPACSESSAPSRGPSPGWGVPGTAC